MKRDGCPSGYKLKNDKCIPKNWRELKEGETFHGIYNYKESHWGKGQTGIVLCKDGSFKVSDNKPIYKRQKGYLKSDESQRHFPTHRNLHKQAHKTVDNPGCWFGIYSFAYGTDRPQGTIWLYPYAPIDKIQNALCNMKGKYGTGDKTRVLFNATDKVLFRLGDIC